MDDGVIGGGEAVFAGVLRGTGFAFRGAGASRFQGVCAIGGEPAGKPIDGGRVVRVLHAVLTSDSRNSRGWGWTPKLGEG
jgi:hypothetical protein